MRHEHMQNNHHVPTSTILFSKGHAKRRVVLNKENSHESIRFAKIRTVLVERKHSIPDCIYIKLTNNELTKDSFIERGNWMELSEKQSVEICIGWDHHSIRSTNLKASCRARTSKSLARIAPDR